MDYTKQELRPLIYKDRTNIDDFEINNPASLDAVMLERIEGSRIVELDGAAEYILEIFNNAYYITTLILMESHPIHYLYSYIQIAEHAGSAYHDVKLKNTFYHYFESITMAMVHNYLCATAPENYDPMKENRLLKAIWDHHNKYIETGQWDSNSRFLFFNNVLNDINLKKYQVNYTFQPLHSPEELLAIEAKKNPAAGSQAPGEPVDNEKVEQLTQEIEELKAQVGILQIDLQAYKEKEKCLRARDASILSLALCNELNQIPADRQNLWHFMNLVWGYTESTSKGQLRAAVKQEEADSLAEQLEDFTPGISKLIKELPQKLKERTDEALYAKNPKIK